MIGTRSGSGNSGSLAAAHPVRDVSLFVSRMSPDTDGEALRAHVEEIAGATTTCDALPQKHENYKSFKVVIKGIQKGSIPDLYLPENWPQDILVKRWFD